MSIKGFADFCNYSSCALNKSLLFVICRLAAFNLIGTNTIPCLIVALIYLFTRLHLLLSFNASIFLIFLWIFILPLCLCVGLQFVLDLSYSSLLFGMVAMPFLCKGVMFLALQIFSGRIDSECCNSDLTLTPNIA